MASKFDEFLKASWNTIFSFKKRQETRNPRKVESAWRNVRIAWGGLWRGKTDVQTPRRVDVRNLALEGLGRTRRPGSNNLARRPQLGGGSLRAFRRAILRFKRVGWSGGKLIAKIDEGVLGYLGGRDGLRPTATQARRCENSSQG